MARFRRSRAATATRTIVVPQRQPAPIIRVSAPAGGRMRRVRRHARRAASAVGRGAASEKHTLTALAAAGAYGLVRKSGVSIPTIGPLGPAATVGLLAWAYGRWGKNQTAQHVATGLLSIAIYSWASTGEIAGADMPDDGGFASEFADDEG
jgi:hypothetical protein